MILIMGQHGCVQRSRRPVIFRFETLNEMARRKVQSTGQVARDRTIKALVHEPAGGVWSGDQGAVQRRATASATRCWLAKRWSLRSTLRFPIRAFVHLIHKVPCRGL
jgi:hypothetical protein